MAETAKASMVARLVWVAVGLVVGFFAAWIALDASQTAGHYWPIQVVSGPMYSLAYTLAADTHSAVLTFVGTAILFGLYAWIVATFRSWGAIAAIAAVHAGLAVAGLATAVQHS
jgi:hypothetical protein